MELSPGQQRLLFAVVVIALVGLGFFLIEGRSHGTNAASTTPTPTPSTSAPAASGAATATPPATEPSAPPSASTAGEGKGGAGGGKGSANIYQWLPFTQSDLTAAAKTTLAFATDYVTWNSKESVTAYGAKMAGLVTSPEDAVLESDFSTAARAAGNAAVSTGSGTIDSITSFGSNSITFLVAIAQQVVPATGTAASPSQYSITVVSTAAGWQVNDIELSTLGNQ
jgi:hypothetical protein